MKGITRRSTWFIGSSRSGLAGRGRPRWSVSWHPGGSGGRSATRITPRPTSTVAQGMVRYLLRPARRLGACAPSARNAGGRICDLEERQDGPGRRTRWSTSCSGSRPRPGPVRALSSQARPGPAQDRRVDADGPHCSTPSALDRPTTTSSTGEPTVARPRCSDEPLATSEPANPIPPANPEPSTLLSPLGMAGWASRRARPPVATGCGSSSPSGDVISSPAPRVFPRRYFLSYGRLNRLPPASEPRRAGASDRVSPAQPEQSH